MTQCYDFNYTSNQPHLLPNVWVPCPVGNNCCIGIDKCMSNNLCYYGGNHKSKEKRTVVGSGFYNARCTDPTYTDPACGKTCIQLPPDVVYNYTSQRWACCGNNTAGEVTCNNPLPEYYEAPAPELLQTLTLGAQYIKTETMTPDPQNAAFEQSTAASGLHISSSTSTPSSTTARSTSALSTPLSSSTLTSASTSSATSTSTASSNSSSLSVGAKAGIGVGVGIGVIAILAALFFLLRYRGAKRKNHDASLVPELPDSRNRRMTHEKDSRETPAELSTTDDSSYFSWQPTIFQAERHIGIDTSRGHTL